MQRKWLADSPHEVARIVEEDLDRLRAGNVNPTSGDIRCVTYGHLIRLAIWSLRLKWNKKGPTASRIAKVADWIHRFGEWAEVQKFIDHDRPATIQDMPLFAVRESAAEYGVENADVPF
jgi:hypothetical protein